MLLDTELKPVWVFHPLLHVGRAGLAVPLLVLGTSPLPNTFDSLIASQAQPGAVSLEIAALDSLMLKRIKVLVYLLAV